jgi:hypothetical protein
MATVQFDKTTNNTSKDEADHIYYNITIKPDELNKGLATFSENRVDAILQNPSLYDLSVIRFTVPAENIPIFIWEDNKFEIVLTYKGVNYKSILQYVENIDPSTFSTFPPSVWNYNDLIQSINLAFEDAYQQLKTAEPLAPFTRAPRIVYDPIDRLNSIFVEPTYSSDITTADKIEVWFNLALGDLFRGFQNFGGVQALEDDPAKIWRIIFRANITNEKTINGVQYLVATEEFSGLFRWNTLKALLFETDMPVVSESQGTQKNVFRQILTDFEPAEGFADTSSIQYFPRGALRFYEMTSTYPLTRVNVKISWEDKDGNIYPVFLSGDDTLTLKLYFKRKGVMIDF